MQLSIKQIQQGGNQNVRTLQKKSESIVSWYDNQCYRVRGGRSFSHLNLRILAGTLTLFLTNQFILKSITENIIVQSYLNDILAMGILLPYSNLLLGLYPGRDIRLMSFGPILVFALGTGSFWELVTPLYLPHSFGDFWDLVAYLSGGVLVWTLGTRLQVQAVAKSA